MCEGGGAMLQGRAVWPANHTDRCLSFILILCFPSFEIWKRQLWQKIAIVSAVWKHVWQDFEGKSIQNGWRTFSSHIYMRVHNIINKNHSLTFAIKTKDIILYLINVLTHRNVQFTLNVYCDHSIQKVSQIQFSMKNNWKKWQNKQRK